MAALSRAIDALGDDQRELGLLLQATRGAASQGNRAAAALARQSGLRFAADPDTPSTPGERLFVAGLAYRETMRGRADRARELALRTLDLLEDPGPSVPAVYVTPLALVFSGALEEATREFGRVLDWARRHGSFLSYVQGSHLRAAAWWRRGNLAEAEADAENAARHPSFMIRPGALVLVELRLAQDDPEGAARLWDDLGMEQDAVAAGRASVQARQLRGRLRAATGRHDEALADLLACRELERAWGIRTPAHSTWRSDAVRLLATLGRSDEAQALSAEDLARARAFGDPRPLGIALRAAGLAQRSIEPLEESVDDAQAVARAARVRALAARARRGAPPRRPAHRRARAAARGGGGRRALRRDRGGGARARRARRRRRAPPARPDRKPQHA